MKRMQSPDVQWRVARGARQAELEDGHHWLIEQHSLLGVTQALHAGWGRLQGACLRQVLSEENPSGMFAVLTTPCCQRSMIWRLC